MAAIIAIPFVTRLVTPEDFANYDIFLLSNAFLSLLVSLGTDSGMAIFLYDNKKERDEYLIAGLWRLYRRCGWKSGERIATLWGVKKEKKAAIINIWRS